MISFCRKILISNLKCKYLHDVNCQDWPFVGENPTKSDYLVMFHHKIYVIRHIPDKLIGANKVREAQGRGLLTTGCTVYICFSLVWLWHQVYRSKSATSCHILCILGGLDLDVLRVDTLSPVSSAWKQNRAMKSTKKTIDFMHQSAKNVFRSLKVWVFSKSPCSQHSNAQCWVRSSHMEVWQPWHCIASHRGMKFFKAGGRTQPFFRHPGFRLDSCIHHTCHTWNAYKQTCECILHCHIMSCL